MGLKRLLDCTLLEWAGEWGIISNNLLVHDCLKSSSLEFQDQFLLVENAVQSFYSVGFFIYEIPKLGSKSFFKKTQYRI